MDWLRWYVGTAADTKFRLVARKAQATVSEVVMLWAMLLERASVASPRGCLAGFDCEVADEAMNVAGGTAERIMHELEQRGMIAAGKIAAWDRRQPKREDGSAERAREWREKQRTQTNANERSARGANANEHGRNVQEAETNAPERAQDAGKRTANAAERSPNATERTQEQGERNRTPDKIREDKRREEQEEETNTLGTTVNEGRARADVVPDGFVSSSDELLGDESQEVAGDELLQAAGTLDMGIEFQELRAHYDQHGRAEAVAAGFAEYKQLRASRQWPGFARIMQAIDDYSTTQKWRAGFAPGLARFLRERWWLKAPMQEAESPATGALDGGDTYTRLLEEVRKEANV